MYETRRLCTHSHISLTSLCIIQIAVNWPFSPCNNDGAVLLTTQLKADDKQEVFSLVVNVSPDDVEVY